MSCLMSKQNLPAAFFWRYGLLDISSKFYIMEAVQRRLLTQKTWGWQHWDVPAPKLTLNPRPFKRKSSLIFLPVPQNVPSKLRSAAWFFHPQPWRRTTTIDVSGGCSFGTIGQWPIQHFFQVDDSGIHRDLHSQNFPISLLVSYGSFNSYGPNLIYAGQIPFEFANLHIFEQKNIERGAKHGRLSHLV